MMKYLFPYPDFGPMEIPEGNLMGVFSPSVLEVEKTEEAIIEEALSHPIGINPSSTPDWPGKGAAGGR